MLCRISCQTSQMCRHLSEIVEQIYNKNFQLFAGVTLSQPGASVTWDPENKDEYPNNFKLIIKQILLGHEAKENEFNVVEVRNNKTSCKH